MSGQQNARVAPSANVRTRRARKTVPPRLADGSDPARQAVSLPEPEITTAEKPAGGVAPTFSADTSVVPASELCDRTGGRHTILLVEDETGLRLMVQKVLQQCGYKVIGAADGIEALHLWASHRPEIDLLLTDLVMPEGITGLQLARKLKAEKPALKVVYTSGFSTERLDYAGEVLIEGKNFVQKPFRRETLAMTVRRALGPEGPQQETGREAA